MTFSVRQSTVLFHLVFLRALVAKGEDKSLIALKGGCGLSTAAASQTLTRLARVGLIRAVRHGTWWLEEALDPLRLPEYLTAPLPS